MDLLTSLIVVIALQYTHIANHCAVHLTFHNVIYFNKAGGKKEKQCGHFWEEWDGENKMHYSLREECKKLTGLLC